ncbi:FAD-dependent monooxygenase [Streptomyces xiamenensis]|nr:FAD-dependent monooxygenase [Streptomyces xiamenensis]
MKSGVIIVGAGPVGLMLAGELRLGGAEVTVYDRLTAPAGESRALGFNRRAAESLDQRGLLPRLGEIRWGPMGHFGGVRFDLGMLDEDHSGVLGLSQARTEAALEGWVTGLGVPVRRGYAVTGFEETAGGVVVAFEGPDGPGQEHAGYLVGCDGAGSTVRTLAGITARGTESTRGMYTAEITGAMPRPRPIGERLPGGAMVVCTPLGEGRCRIVIHDRRLPARPDTRTLTFATVADAWQRLTGESVHAARPHWVWARGNDAALADSYRRGRVFLAGDAAHDLPPLAAWGLSAGIQDAVNLGWKLAAVIRGTAPEALLDTYHAERHPVGERLLRDARAASAVYLGDAAMTPLRDVLGELAGHRDTAARLAGIVSGLTIRYPVGGGDHPLLGLRMPPDRTVLRRDGSGVRVAELLRAARGVLVLTGGGGERLVSVAAGWADRVDTVTGEWSPGADGLPQAVLIRPDGYVAWTAPGGGGGLEDALGRWFGPARGTVGER